MHMKRGQTAEGRFGFITSKVVSRTLFIIMFIDKTNEYWMEYKCQRQNAVTDFHRFPHQRVMLIHTTIRTLVFYYRSQPNCVKVTENPIPLFLKGEQE